MSGKTTTSINRRGILTLAAEAVVAAPGCSLLEAPEDEPAASVPGKKREKPSKPKSVVGTRRLFTISVEGSSKWEERSPILDKWNELSSLVRMNGDLLNAWSATPEDLKPEFVGWLKPTTAAELRKVDGVKAVVAHKPGDPVKSTIGPLRRQLTEPPTDGKRNLIVVLGPNSWSNSTGVSDFEPHDKIASKWADELKSVEGVSVEPIKAAKWDVINKAGVHIGPRPGQIRVVIEGDEAPEKVLNTLQSHPQTERLQWDHAEVIYNCPPCGMG
jgi:hypothetical protein